MHDKPGTIIVNLQRPMDVLQQDLDDAFSQADFVFANDTIAVFTHGYNKPEGQ